MPLQPRATVTDALVAGRPIGSPDHEGQPLGHCSVRTSV